MHYVYDAASYGSTAMQNAMGSLAEAYTGTSSSKTTDLYFSKYYSGNNTVSQAWEATPHSNGYFLTTDTYYPNGALQARTTSYGAPSVTYGLDGEGRPNTATDTTNNLNLITAASYNNASAATGVSYGNGDSDTFGYDSMNRPSSILYNVTGSNHFTITSTLNWNANSTLNQMQITDTNDATKSQTCTYTADDLSRLKSVNCGSSTWAQNFTYDAFGNINKSGSGNYAAAYNALTNQVSSGVATSYDANGNQLSSTGLSSISWNAAGQPATVTALTGSPIAGTYDALGRLVETAQGSAYTQFVFSPGGAKVAVVKSGALVKATIPLPGGETAVYNASGLNFIRHTDWLGSSRLATTWAHAVYSKESYAPFGETYNEAGTADRSFTGQDQDLATGAGGTGAYDYLFRKYDPAAGRWLSPDPKGWGAVHKAAPQSLNRYAYVQNNPLKLIDQGGMDCVYAGVSVSDTIIVRGNCDSDDDDGVFVDGHIDSLSQEDNGTTIDAHWSPYTAANDPYDPGNNVASVVVSANPAGDGQIAPSAAELVQDVAYETSHPVGLDTFPNYYSATWCDVVCDGIQITDTGDLYTTEGFGLPGLSLTVGYIDDPNVSSDDFMNKFGTSLGGFDGLGGVDAWSPGKGNAQEFGFGTPGVSASVGWSTRVWWW
jgi:RHS repeat-associated protein